jgi:hypothetical protein
MTSSSLSLNACLRYSSATISRVAQIDHLIQAVTDKVVGHGATFKNSPKTASIEYLFGNFDHQ